jgi:hypothetical protein
MQRAIATHNHTRLRRIASIKAAINYTNTN